MTLTAVITAYLCLAILSATTVLDSFQQRNGIRRMSMTFSLIAVLVIILLPPVVDVSRIQISALPVFAFIACLRLCFRPDRCYMAARVLAVLIFSAFLFFLSMLGLDSSRGLLGALTMALSGLYCAGVAQRPQDAFFLALLCVCSINVAGGVWEAAVNSYVYFDVASSDMLISACSSAIAAFVVRDIFARVWARKRAYRLRAARGT